MKKISLFVAIAVLALLLVSCAPDPEVPMGTMRITLSMNGQTSTPIARYYLEATCGEKAMAEYFTSSPYDTIAEVGSWNLVVSALDASDGVVANGSADGVEVTEDGLSPVTVVLTPI